LVAPPRCSLDTRPGGESVYPENNREVMPKPCLESEQTKETNPSTHPRAVQNAWTIQNRYSRRYAMIYICPIVSLSNGRRLTGLRDLRPWDKKRGYTEGGGGVRLAGSCRVGAVARRRGAGRPVATRKTTGVTEVLRLGSDGLCSAKKEHTGSIQKFGSTSPAR
jgi:hypothetical protein